MDDAADAAEVAVVLVRNIRSRPPGATFVAAAVVVVDDDEVVVWDDETNGIEYNGEGMIRDGERLQSEPIADHLVHGGRKKEAFRYA
mmetsp:Transcript_15978/g.23197  ORF Transcript_15978/g.23197 Transcript_15978/m.23197 type:complete len:87 (+) Transcript_15978:1221-1481(+)